MPTWTCMQRSESKYMSGLVTAVERYAGCRNYSLGCGLRIGAPRTTNVIHILVGVFQCFLLALCPIPLNYLTRTSLTGRYSVVPYNNTSPSSTPPIVLNYVRSSFLSGRSPSSNSPLMKSKGAIGSTFA